MITNVLKSRRQKKIKGICDSTKEIRRYDVKRTRPGFEDREHGLCWKSHENGFSSRGMQPCQYLILNTDMWQKCLT